MSRSSTPKRITMTDAPALELVTYDDEADENATRGLGIHVEPAADIGVFAPLVAALVGGGVAGSTSAFVEIQWGFDGYVIDMLGCPLGATTGDLATTGMASLEVEILKGPNARPFFVNGAVGGGSVFAAFATLFGLAGTHSWPVRTKVRNSEIWQIRFRNQHAATTFTPRLRFGARRLCRGKGR